MRSRSLLLVSVLMVTPLLATACGGGGGIAISRDQPKGLSKEACAEFESEDPPSAGLAAKLPAKFRPALEATIAFGEALDAGTDGASLGNVDQLDKALGVDGLGDDLEALSAYVEKECGASGGSAAIAVLATTSRLASTPRDDAYCEALAAQFASDGSGEGTGLDAIAAMGEVAPEAHKKPLESLKLLSEETGALTSEQESELSGALFGLGIYAEAKCGIDEAMGQMMLGALLLGGAGPLDSGESTDDTAAPPSTIDPASMAPVDVNAANASVPAGAGITFESRTTALDEDGEYSAAVAVPSGWEVEVSFGASFSPPAGSAASIFTSIDVNSGCDGLCEATDWEARLRGPDGYLTQYLANNEGAVETPVSGSEGTMVTVTGSDYSVLVLRWDDGADQYFSCEATLDESEAALLPAFAAACLASRPAWFPVA